MSKKRINSDELIIRAHYNKNGNYALELISLMAYHKLPDGFIWYKMVMNMGPFLCNKSGCLIFSPNIPLSTQIHSKL